MSITFKFLEAGVGDAILISSEGKNILIDGGEKYQKISSSIDKIDKQELLDLVILTHIDCDHIKGLIELLKKEEKIKLLREIWFNPSLNDLRFGSLKQNRKTSAKQGLNFTEKVKELMEVNPHISCDTSIYLEEKKEDIKLFNSENLTVKLLSPPFYMLEKLEKEYQKPPTTASKKTSNITDEVIDQGATIESLAQFDWKKVKDRKHANGASIAFILSYKTEYQFLLLADAHIDIIIESLKNLGYSIHNKLKVNFVKLSHHASKCNINQDFLDLIETDTFIISTNGKKHNHPNDETLSKIIMDPTRNKAKKINFFFNYDSVRLIKTKKEYFNGDNKDKYNFSFKCLDKNKGITYG